MTLQCIIVLITSTLATEGSCRDFQGSEDITRCCVCASFIEMTGDSHLKSRIYRVSNGFNSLLVFILSNLPQQMRPVHPCSDEFWTFVLGEVKVTEERKKKTGSVTREDFIKLIQSSHQQIHIRAQFYKL